MKVLEIKDLHANVEEKEILKYEKKLATSDKERNRLQEEYNQYLKEVKLEKWVN